MKRGDFRSEVCLAHFCEISKFLGVEFDILQIETQGK